MKARLRDSDTFYINAALAVAILLILVFIIRPFFMSSDKNAAIPLKQDNVPVVSEGASESAYDIDKVKNNISSGSAGGSAEYSDLEDMYKNCDKNNVGGNMVDAWRRVKPEDKGRLSKGFDEQIVASQETLKKDPGNKHAKNLLYISEQLKKMSTDGFNYKLKNKKI
jgi:uncharacterized membrane protein